VNNTNSFKFYCPVDLIKSTNPDTGEEEMRFKGIASSANEDSQGEFLDPTGFDLTGFRWINWNHLGKSDPGMLIGEPDPTKTKITASKELYIEGLLYKEMPAAVAAFQLMKALRNSPTGNKLSMSVEGKVLRRDPRNPKKILSAKITAVALCPVPINGDTWADVVKGEFHDPTETIYEEETLNMIKQSPDLGLSKSDIFDAIYAKFPGIEIEKAKQVYTLIQKVKTMTKNTTVSDETIQKSFAILDLASAEIAKGEAPNKGDKKVTTEEDEEENEKVVKDSDRSKTNVEKAEDEEEEDEEVAERAHKHAKEMKKSGCEKEMAKVKLIKKGYGHKLAEKAIYKAYRNEAEENEAGEKEAHEANAKLVEKSFSKLENLLKSQANAFDAKFKAIGTVLAKQLEENNELKKSLEETLNTNAELSEQINAVLSTPNRPKSVITKSFADRFAKSENGEDVFSLSSKADRKALSSKLMDLSGIEKSEDGNVGVNKQYTKIAQDLELAGTIESRDIPALAKLGIKVVA